MDFPSRRSTPSTSSSSTSSSSKAGRFFSLNMHKSSSSSTKTCTPTPPTATTTKQQANLWSASAPGIARRQSHTEWLSGNSARKALGQYARIPTANLSPTNEYNTNGNNGGRMSVASSRSSNADSPPSSPVKVLFDDCPAASAMGDDGEGRENFVGKSKGVNVYVNRRSKTLMDASAEDGTIGTFPKPLTKSPDVMSVESARVAQRLASPSSATHTATTGISGVLRTGNLISFREEQPEELLLVDTGSDDLTQQQSAKSASFKHNGKAAGNSLLPLDRPTTLAAHNSTKKNGFTDAKNVRPRTSLETIRQQIRQIESEIRVSNSSRGSGGSSNSPHHHDHDFDEGYMSRPIQSSFSSQSIPANFDSCEFESSRHQRSNNKFHHPHMQRAYSVDVAVHSAISDIQSAVRRNSMIRLKSSTSALQHAGIEEEDDNVWVKRDSSAQTEMQEVREDSLGVPVAPVGRLLPSMTPELTDEEMENESGKLLSQENSADTDNSCDNRIGSLSRPLTARRPSCQSAHDLIEGVLFRCCYLGSTHLFSDSRPTKSSRLNQAQEAVTRIKAPDGESQPMTDVDLFISMEKIMVLNVDIQDILMDHPLRTISYIADIGDLVVLMVKRGLEDLNCDAVLRSTQPKMLCHVFQSDEASMIAQTIGNAFQVAYMEYLKANGIQDDRYLRHLDYLEVLNSQEMSTNELDLFASKDKQSNVVIPKQKGEILGVVIVESGWGSMLPTVIIANLCPSGPGARCGKLSIGDQLISINGISLVGLPLAQCQTTIKNVKNHTVVKLTIVSCPPVVEVRIKRPDTRYQLGFSVQNGIICSLLRGGIAERGGIRVGHRIIEINGQSVVATNHENIVNMLAHSVGEIELKTMPSSIFRLLTGQDTPVYI